MHNELTDSIRNLWPQPEEAATLSAGNWPPGGKLVEDYALITHMPGPGFPGPALQVFLLPLVGWGLSLGLQLMIRLEKEHRRYGCEAAREEV